MERHLFQDYNNLPVKITKAVIYWCHMQWIYGIDEIIKLSHNTYKDRTHFIILDADEVFNENFIDVGRNFIRQLEFGEVLQLLWVSCYPDMNHYASGNSPWAPKHHDFIFCDSKQSYYPKSGLHFGRIPALSGKRVKVDSNIGVVLHKQFIFKEDFELKQCLYRMHEFLEGKSSTFAINHTYSITRYGFNDIADLPQIWQSKEGFFSY